MTYTEKDLQNLQEIVGFLTEHDIEFSTELNNMCLNFGTEKQFEIEYVPALAFPMEQKKYGIPGVPQSYFHKLSRLAEEEQNSFKFFVKQFEWEHPLKREVLKSYMLHAAGKTPTKFAARHTEVKIFTNKEIRSFEEQNCFYGYRSASLNLGLVLRKDINGYKKGDLLMLMTFGKNFFGKATDVVEVFRAGTLKNCQVIGGSSKLFNHFVKNHKVLEIGEKEVKYSKIVYYVDYDHGNGKSLEKMGFKFARFSAGGFMNYDIASGKISHRDPMHHGEIMKRVQAGEMIAIPNSGTKVYEYLMDENKEFELETEVLNG
jgi:hypothetical protein